MPAKRLLALAAILSVPLAANAFLIPPAPPSAVEFVNVVTDHYVLIRDPQEVAAIEAGAAGPGWKRTGYAFNVDLPRTEAVDGNACRFYSPSANSHFHTAFAEECSFLRAHPERGWIFEKYDFYVLRPYGNCELMQRPVYRLYNNGGTRNDPNHRYTASEEARDEMVARGWTLEGVAFCTASAGYAPAKRYTIVSRKLAPTAECENEDLNLGSCVALNQLPPMPNKVQAFLPPWYVTPNPDFPLGLEAVTGVSAHDVSSAFTDSAALVSHSFLQDNGPSSPGFGIHVNSLDRTMGELSSINPLYQFPTRTPAAGQPDGRLFPWGDGRDNHLDLSFALRVKTLVRADPASHAYGHPTLQFVDRTTGQHLYVTLGTYGSTPIGGEDYLARDTGTGRVIVSTTFRADPSFGQRISGEWIPCPGDGACLPAATDQFRFRIDRAAFAKVLARARTLAPSLSPAPYDYFVANFHFNNEVYRDGRIGLVLADYTLEVHDR